MRPLLFAYAALFLSCSAPCADAGERFLKIGAWNIEHLGHRSPPQRPIAIAEHIELSGVNLLCMEEIYDSDDNPDTRTNDALDSAFAILNESGDSWRYVLLPNKDRDDTSQLCAIAWNETQVHAVGEPFRIPVTDDSTDEFNTWDRHPHAMKFSAGTGKADFVVIPVHMKSNVDTSQFGRTQRSLEARQLVERLPAVRQHFSDRDIIILGDTNILDANEPAETTIVGAGFRGLNAHDAATFARGSAPFDRIYVSRQRPALNYSRQYVLRSAEPEEHEEYLSDHFLILTTVKVVADDD